MPTLRMTSAKNNDLTSNHRHNNNNNNNILNIFIFIFILPRFLTFAGIGTWWVERGY